MKAWGLMLVLSLWCFALQGPIWAQSYQASPATQSHLQLSPQDYYPQQQAETRFRPSLASLAIDMEDPLTLGLTLGATTLLLALPALPFLFSGRPIEAGLRFVVSTSISLLIALGAGIGGWFVGTGLIEAIAGDNNPISKIFGLIFGLIFALPFAIVGFLLSQSVLITWAFVDAQTPPAVAPGAFTVMRW